MPGIQRTPTMNDARANAPATARSRRRRMPAPDATPRDEANDVITSELPRDERVRRLAYCFYEQRGGGDGQAMDDWLRAEMEIARDAIQATRAANDGH